jgi:mutator protein MutT|tara:strand:+ start:189 stop:566 length:378 start_codon:yes stop_codon:yes gene_type:complete
MKKVNVSAAVIVKDNKYFIAKRNKDKHLGGYFEFPGGKQDDNETLEQTVIREIKEELNVDITVDRKLGEEHYSDEKINVHLHYFFCTIIKGDIVLKEHEEAAWVSKEEFNKYKFAEGDKDIISLL